MTEHKILETYKNSALYEFFPEIYDPTKRVLIAPKWAQIIREASACSTSYHEDVNKVFTLHNIAKHAASIENLFLYMYKSHSLEEEHIIMASLTDNMVYQKQITNELQNYGMKFKRLVFDIITLNKKRSTYDSKFREVELVNNKAKCDPLSGAFTRDALDNVFSFIQQELKKLIADVSSHRCQHQIHLNSNYFIISQIQLQLYICFRNWPIISNKLTQIQRQLYQNKLFHLRSQITNIILNYIQHGYFNPEWSDDLCVLEYLHNK